MKPTEEQKQWFWEQCGICYHDWVSSREIDFNTFRLPNGKSMSNDGYLFRCVKCGVSSDDSHQGHYDMFKYAVPLMQRVFIDINNEYRGKKRNEVRVLYKGSFYDGAGEHLEDAIFEAIFTALGGKE